MQAESRSTRWLYSPYAPMLGAAAFTFIILLAAALWCRQQLRAEQQQVVRQTLAFVADVSDSHAPGGVISAGRDDLRRQRVPIESGKLDCSSRLAATAAALGAAAPPTELRPPAEAACGSGRMVASLIEGGTALVAYRPLPAADGTAAAVDVIVLAPGRTPFLVFGRLPIEIPFALAATALAGFAGYHWSRTTQRRIDGLERLAATDGLTGALRREAFLATLSLAIENARRRSRPLSALIIDLDGLKPVNDRFGHAVGDRVLETVASAIRQTLRDSDVVGRLGGDEFAALLARVGPDEAAIVAERVRAAVERDGGWIDGFPTEVTVSIGVTTLRQNDTAAALIARGDLLLYQAKRGRNRVVPIS